MSFPIAERPEVCSGRKPNSFPGLRSALAALSLPTVPMLLTLALAHTGAYAQTYLDTALAGETYRIQGEYSGTVGTKPYGAQVIAWGNGKFEATMLPGGLPGAGWGSAPTNFKVVTGSTSGSNTVFTTTGWSMVIKAGGAAIEGTGPDGALKMSKVYRESPSLNWAGPADAVKLFDGTQAAFNANWTSGSIVQGKYLSEGSECNKAFADHTLHLEFRAPFEPLEDGQGRGNSGVYVQGRYEVQVLDSFGWMKGQTEHGGAEGWAGGIYDTRPADFNMAMPPLRWETYDIWLVHPKFNGNTKTTNGRITVWFNGVKVQDNVELPGTTPGNFEGESAAGGKLALQDHGGPMWYRNIWAVPGKFVPIPISTRIITDRRAGPTVRTASPSWSGTGVPYMNVLGARRIAAPHGPYLMLYLGEKKAAEDIRK